MACPASSLSCEKPLWHHRQKKNKLWALLMTHLTVLLDEKSQIRHKLKHLAESHGRRGWSSIEHNGVAFLLPIITNSHLLIDFESITHSKSTTYTSFLKISLLKHTVRTSSACFASCLLNVIVGPKPHIAKSLKTSESLLDRAVQSKSLKVGSHH